MTTDTQELYQRARSTWGDTAQIDLCIEELAELIVALQHYRRGRCHTPEVVEELADVLIMVEQVTAILDVDCAVRARKRDKLARLEQRLGDKS